MGNRWKLVLTVPNHGHRYFEETGTGRIGVADNSGHYPEQTEDGVLYLDRDRAIEIGGDERVSAMIPLMRPDGERCATGETAAGGLLVAKTLGCKVNLHGWLSDFVENIVFAPNGSVVVVTESGAQLT